MSKDAAHLPYRPCVGVMLTDGNGRVFVGSRLDREAGEAWQMPQGGIDKGEDLEAAARRELFEETGIQSIEIIAESQDWLTYDLPPHLLGKALKGRYRGQTQKWFLARFTGKDSEIRLDLHEPEFETWKWAAVDDLPMLIVPFKKALYEALVAEFGDRVKALATP
ncbi:MAG: RNA pyrophosphohydrolase [Micropepsaceae bacterium]